MGDFVQCVDCNFWAENLRGKIGYISKIEKINSTSWYNIRMQDLDLNIYFNNHILIKVSSLRYIKKI